MEPYQQRVINERDELQEKVTKLDAFLGGEDRPRLDENTRDLLDRQFTAMTIYLDILTERIATF